MIESKRITRWALVQLGALTLVLAISCGSGSATSTSTSTAGDLTGQVAGADSSQGAPKGAPPQGNPPTGTPPGPPPGGASAAGGDQLITPPGAGQSNAPTGYNAELVAKSSALSQNGTTITSTTADSSVAAALSQGSLTLTNVNLKKAGGNASNEDSSNFYGVNAGLLAADSGVVSMSGGTITTDAEGSNAVFSTGSTSVINISNAKIVTSKNSSRGVDATMGATINANNLDITTSGAHSATIATDRGEGFINVKGGTFKTSGEGSPAIYSTGSISVSNATLSATGSEAAVIEGKNSITLKNSSLHGAKLRGVMLYQSFSGDAAVGTSVFTMEGGSLGADAGPLFYSTNTRGVINLKGVKLPESQTVLLQLAADKWGTPGQNGAVITLNASGQALSGDILVGNTSTLVVNLADSSTLRAGINASKEGRSVNLTLDASSTWVVSGDSCITVLKETAGTSLDTLSNIKSQGHKIYYLSAANLWLGGKTIPLADGGSLIPY